MKRRAEQHRLPYSAEAMFDLAADVERYPEFLPHWSVVTIRAREGDRLIVDQELDLGIQRLRFTSQASLRRPERLQIRSSQPPFRTLLIDWRFRSMGEAGCLVSLAVEVDMRSLLLEAAAGQLMRLMTGDILLRFCRRAQALYGVRDLTPERIGRQ
jgi:coenzyme Q-binding protein COQ10